MIPATYPSILDSSNRTKMLVYQVPSIVGLTRWVDYIPVKSPASESDLTLANTFANEGFILTSKVNDITGLVPFKDYIPIYLDSTATKAWSADNDGYIPMAELAGLLLDFTTGALDPRIAFTRATNATVTNSAGQITYAPHNLLTFSEQFDNAAWTKTATMSVTANASIAPNNTTTADLITRISAGTHYVRQQATVIANTRYTYSIYIKPNSSTTFILTEAGVSGSNAAFTLTGSGSVVVVNQGGDITATIALVDNGYYRCSISYTTGVSQTTLFINNNTDSGYLWGAQLEVGASPTTYNSTTVKNLLGYSELFDNAAWTKSNSFVQTNLLTYSEAFDDASWTKTRATVTANSIVAPNGTQTADKIVEDTNLNSRGMSRNLSTTPVSSPVTFSVYLKAGERQYVQIQLTDNAANVNGTLNMYYVAIDLATGIVGTPYSSGSPTSPSYTVTNAGNGWWRVSVSLTKKADATRTDVGINFVTSNNAVGTLPTTQGDGTSGFYSWGAQLVQGSVAGDYRRTDAATLPVFYPNHNGVVCAEKLVEGVTTANNHVVQVSSVTSLIGGVYTLSVYAKAAERGYIVLYDSTASKGKFFDLLTGVVGGNFVGAPTSASITSVGNGWYRCSITYTSTVTALNPRVYVANSISSATYNGDGTSGIYIFGAQLSDSASLDPYVLNAAAAPTAAAYYGARFDYDPITLAPKGLLIEEQRQNLLLNSTLPATNLATQSVTVTAVAHTLSFYGTGTVTIAGTYVGSLVGSDAYPTRSTLTFTPTAGVVLLTVTGSVQFAQLEIGAFATSFIPTAASQVTRAADVATIQGSNFYSWYNQNEGSVYANSNTYSTAVTPIVASYNDGTVNNRIQLGRTNASSVALRVFVVFNSVEQVSGLGTGTTTATEYAKVSFGYATNNFIGAVNNTLTSADTSGSLPITSRFEIGFGAGTGGYLNGTIKQISYYPQRLSNETLKGLTA